MSSRRGVSWLFLLAMACLWSTVSTAASFDDDGTPATADADSKLEQARNVQCLPGLERFLPGEYYYCVGARDLARDHDASGIDMLKLAAGWGSKAAQFTLGVAYFNGDSAPQDHSLGLAWLALAAERRDGPYVAVLQSAWNKSTAQERQQAAILQQRMTSKYGDAYAAHRAEQRYHRARDELVRNEVYGAQICIAGLTSTQVVSVEENGQASCIGSLPVEMVAKKVDVYADFFFDGWVGHVSVGALQQVPAPATDSPKK